MSIQDINRYVDGIFNQKLDGSGDLTSISLHFDLMRDRMDQLVQQITHYTALKDLKEQPWLEEQMFEFIRKTCHDFLTKSNDINRDISFMQSHPFDQQVDPAKFNVYAMNLMAYIDERENEHPSAIEIMKGWFGKGKQTYHTDQYMALVAGRATYVDGKFQLKGETKTPTVTEHIQHPTMAECVTESVNMKAH